MSGHSGKLVTQIEFTGLEQIKNMFAQIESNFNSHVQKMNENGKKIGDGLTKSTNAVQTALKNTATVGVRSFNILASSASAVVTTLSTITSIAISVGKTILDIGAKVAVGGAASYGVVRAWVSNTAKDISELNKTAKDVGISIDSFSRLASAVRATGGDTSDLTSGMQSLSEKIIEAAKNADSQAAGAFVQVGVSVRDANGDIKDTETVLREVSDGLSQIPSDTLKASAAMDLFGGAGKRLLPVLGDGSDALQKYMDDADKLHTALSEEDAAASDNLLKEQRRIAEAWKGLGFTVAESLLPAFTRSSNNLVDFLDKNNQVIADFISEKVVQIQGIATDFAHALGISSGTVERQWIQRLAPAIRLVRDLLLDTFDLLNGEDATRLPWLNDLTDAFGNAIDAGKAFTNVIFKAAHIELPTMAQATKLLKDAMSSLRNGIEGGVRGAAALPWASDVGRALRSLGEVVGVVSSTIYKHKDQITGTLASISNTFYQFVSAVSQMLNGEKISKDNPFQFLQPVADFVEKYGQSISDTFTHLLEDVGTAFKFLFGYFEQFYGYVDDLAKAMGLRSGLQLGLIIFVATLLGIPALIQKIGTGIATFVIIVANILGIFKSVFELANLTVIPFISWITGLIMTLLPEALAAGAAGVAVFAGVWALVAAAIAALLYLMYEFKDEIFAILKWLGSALWTASVAIVKAIAWPYEKFFHYMKVIAQSVGLIDPDAIAKPFEDAGSKISDSADKMSSDVKDAYAGIDDSANSSAENGKKKMEELVKAVSDKSKGLDLGDKFDDIKNKGADAAEKLKEKFSSLGKDQAGAVDSLSAGFNDGFANGDQKIADLKDKIGNLPDDVKPDLEKLKKTLGDSVSGLDDKTLSDLQKRISETAKSAKSGLDSAINAPSDQPAKAVDAAKQSADIKQLIDQTDTYQSTAMSRLKDTWGNFESFFGGSIARVQGYFTDLWSSFIDTPAAAYDATTSSWSGFDNYFETLTATVGSYFQNLWDNITAGSAGALSTVQALFGPATSSQQSQSSSQLPGFATGGIIRGPGTSVSDSILARLSTGEGILNAAAVRWLGEDTVHALNNMMMPQAFSTGGIAGGATSGSMPNLGSINLGIDGQRVANIYADQQAVNAISRKLRTSAQAAQGPRPRWAGGV